MITKPFTILTLALALGSTGTFAQTATKVSRQDTTEATKIFRFVDQQPNPKGGQQAFQEYLEKHVQYPKMAIENNIQGRVIIQFIVTEEGKLSDFVILKDIGGGCGEAVRKVLEEYPYTWTPGKTNGKPVKSYFVVPFTFSMR
ncbi:MAG TPA: energy transducer TonB [Edaphocola sp.]|nr:energy transducer TonB [Edaphocola sp.]